MRYEKLAERKMYSKVLKIIMIFVMRVIKSAL